MKFFLVLFTLLVLGCVGWQEGSGHYKVYLDPNFTQDKQVLVKQAVNKWETMVDREVTFRYTNNWKQENNLITISPGTIESLTNIYGDLNDAKEGQDVLGETHYEGTSSLIFVAIDMEPPNFLETTEHELGHALGLEHSGLGTVMYWSQDGAADEVVCADVQQFCEVWDCDPWKLSGCQL